MYTVYEFKIQEKTGILFKVFFKLSFVSISFEKIYAGIIMFT